MLLTGEVVIVNSGEAVAPAETVTLGGTVVLGSLLVRPITRPPAGAGPLNETLLDEVTVPPATTAGEIETAVMTGASTVRVAALVAPL